MGKTTKLGKDGRKLYIVMGKNQMKHVAVIIPTYNAAQLICKTIDKVLATIPQAKVIVVDDNSPDKTSAIVKKYFKTNLQVIVVDRMAKDGRGSAVRKGFDVASKDKNIEYFIEMDGDLCHDPQLLKQMVEKCYRNDVVIASRYLPESKIIGWNFKRKFLSRLINTFAKMILRIPVTDYTDGYRCYSKKAILFLQKYTLISKGFIVLSEMLYICYKNKLSIVEIPVVFQPVDLQKSNLTRKEMKESIITLCRLRVHNYKFV